MYKIYIEGQYFFLEITGKLEALQDHKQDVRIYPLDDAAQTFMIKSPLIGNHEVALAEMVDENDVPFTLDGWESFYTSQTGAAAIDDYKKGSIDLGINFINANVAGQIYALCGIRVNPLNPGEFAAIVNYTAMQITNDDFLIRVYKNPTIAGVVNWVDIPGTPVQQFIADPAGTNIVSAGEKTQSKYFNLTSAETLIDGVDSIDGDTYVLAAVPITALMDVFGSINFKY